MKKVSVLVAVYNTRPFLSRCLDSLLQQTHPDIEVLCVDDASTDGSWETLCAYAARDARIRIMRQPVNLGQAVARNRALRMAAGCYVAMVDSDDWLAPDALERAVAVFEEASQTDAVLFRLVEHYEEDGSETVYPVRTGATVLSGFDAFRLSLDWRIHGLYLVRAALHKQYPFDETCRLYSDDNTTRIHFLHSREVRFCDGVYYYRKHAASMTMAVSMRRFDYMEANLSMRRQLLREHVPASVIRFYEGHRWLNFIGVYWFYYRHKAAFSSGQHQEIFTRMRRMLSTFTWRSVPLHRRVKLGYMLLKPFALFRFQEEIYFHLRGWLGRNL